MCGFYAITLVGSRVFNALHSLWHVWLCNYSVLNFPTLLSRHDVTKKPNLVSTFLWAGKVEGLPPKLNAAPVPAKAHRAGGVSPLVA